MPESKPLEYDRTAATVTVRGFRTLLILLVINTLMLGWFVVGPRASTFAQQQWRQWQAKREARQVRQQMVALQQQCLTHTFPQATVVLEEDPDQVKRLIVDGAYVPVELENSSDIADWVPPAQIGRSPAAWRSFTATGAIEKLTVSPQLPVVFLHERTSPGGKRLLVVVHLLADQRFSGSNAHGEIRIETRRRLLATTIEPGTPDAAPVRRDSRELSLRLPPSDATVYASPRKTIRRGRSVRIFAGEVDPDDASHFTIRYDVGGTPGVIDGWLHDDGVLLKPRAGQPIVWHGTAAWELPNAPTTAPTSIPAPDLAPAPVRTP
ncbi:MAG: hypothetical protein M3478_15675 [Planctomycetota bacterium]|nr:hypothetical protein [Planctomycetota bacterium]